MRTKMSRFIFKQVNNNQEILLAQTAARQKPILNLANLMLDLEFRHTKEEFEQLSPILYRYFSKVIQTQNWKKHHQHQVCLNQGTYILRFIE